MSILVLKIISFITMIVDHTGIIFFPNNDIFRIIGRISFPIFAFFIVEGYFHSKNINKYLFRILFLALISEVIFDYLFYHQLICWDRQNTCFELFLGLYTIYIFDKSINNKYKILPILLLIVSIFISNTFNLDYSYKGIILIFCFYLINKLNLSKIKRILYLSLSITIFFSISMITTPNINYLGIFLSLPILFLYNGKLGYNNKFLKYLFYFLYPLHLLILLVLS